MANASRDENDVPTLLGVSNSDGKTPVTIYADPVTHRLLVGMTGGGGTVTEVDTGTGLTGGPITSSGTISLDSKLAPLDTLGSAGQIPRVNAGATALEYYTPSAGTVTAVSVASSNGFAGSSSGGATPALTLTTTITGILQGNGTAISAASTTGTGNVVLATSPSFSGATITTSTVNGVTLTTGGGTTTFLNANGAYSSPAGSGTVNSGTAGQLAYYATSTTAVSGNADATISNGALTLGVATSVLGQLLLSGSTSGTTTVTPNVTASGTLTLPAATDTLVGRATTDTLTNKTITSSTDVLGGVTMTLGSDATGDTYYRASGTTLTRLAVGSTGNVLTVSGGIPSWAPPAAATAITVGTTTVGSGTTGYVLYDNGGTLGNLQPTGSGLAVLQTSPTLITPTLGVATATTINGLQITSTSAILTLPSMSTVAFGEGMTLTSGSNGNTYTFPSASDTVVTLAATQTLTNKTLTAPAITTVAETGIGTADLLAPNNHTITVSSNAGSASQSFLVNTFTNSSASAMTITIPVATPTPKDGQFLEVRIYDFSGVAESVTWVNTENSTTTVPATSNGSTTLPLSVLFQYNAATSKWRCVAST